MSRGKVGTLGGYRLRYCDALDKRFEIVKQSLTTEKLALRKLLKVKSDLVNGNMSKVDHSNLTISQWLDIWFET